MSDFNAKVTAKLATLTSKDSNTIDGSATTSLIGSIKRRGAILDVDMHVAAVAALTLSSLHRDANSAALLLNAMPKGSRAATLALWFETFGNIIVSKDPKSKAYRCKMQPEDQCKPVDLVKAQATPFWSKPEQVTGTFDDATFAKAIAALIKKAEGENAKLTDAGRAALADLKVALVKNPAPAKADA